jgi:hypothetical protein
MLFHLLSKLYMRTGDVIITHPQHTGTALGDAKMTTALFDQPYPPLP